jgi:NAD(P)H dehydrogenase (quinone)
MGAHSVFTTGELFMLVVTAATGKLGRLVVEALITRLPASDIAIVVRRPEAAAELAARGVQVRRGDYAAPDTLGHSFAAGDKVLLISSNEVGQRVAQHTAVIAAAKRAGVGLLAYTSVLHGDRSPLALADDHKRTEEAIRASGLPFVFLRNSWYFENYTQQIGTILQHGAMVGAAGDGRFSAAARQDYAEAAAAVLAGEGHENTIHELAGEPAFTLAELAAEIAAQTGRTISYTNLAPEQFKAVLIGAGLPEPYADLLVDSEVWAAQGALYDDSGDLRRLIGRPTTTLKEAVAAALKTPPAAH